ncbi:MAG TPA: DUF177 domain-containing protein [Burkholderiaceae bacterium]|jgi:uncharacterized protein|nr:DUF177 domain-containing protein [Burkholderiaceae bacterium]
MKAREFNPVRLDVEAFAREAGELQGEWPQSQFERLNQSCSAGADPAAVVDWQARGELRERRGAVPEVWLHLTGRTVAKLECQRCLQPVEEPLEFERSFRFVDDEAQAAKLDEDSEEDVLALTRSLDLRELVEDELLLALPIVPRHEVCPQPLASAHSPEDFEEAERVNPFAALRHLKGTPRQ